MRHIETNKEWNDRQPFTIHKQELFSLETTETTFNEVVSDHKPSMVRFRMTNGHNYYCNKKVRENEQE